MKKRTKIMIICILTIMVIGLIVALFVTQYYVPKVSTETSEIIFTNNIINPDRIVYRNQNGQYYQFAKDTETYNQIIENIKKSLSNYSESGNTLTEEEIDTVHEKSFIEFDYETVSKNYIIPLEENEKANMIKLGNTGGIVVSNQLRNLEELNALVEEQSQNAIPYEFEYQELLSRNTIASMEYRYLQQFKQINYKIYQVKIQDMESYELYKEMCNLAFDEEITNDIFENNDLILTISLVPKITVKVNIGNIQYTYENMNDVDYQYTAHLLIVSKIVNTDCIYNTDLTEIEAEVERENFETEYDKKVDNLNTQIFVKDFDSFYKEYQNETGEISQERAEEIVEVGFEEAERVVGNYDKETQECTEIEVRPNNFFTRKYSEGDKMEQYTVQVYAFSRQDDMGNGVQIYVDKRLGKIVGARAFGD